MSYYGFMLVRVDRKHIDEWIDANGPNGLKQLAKNTGLSEGFLSQVRIGRVPKRRYNRIRLANIVGVTEDELFPVTAGENVS